MYYLPYSPDLRLCDFPMSDTIIDLGGGHTKFYNIEGAEGHSSKWVRKLFPELEKFYHIYIYYILFLFRMYICFWGVGYT